MATIDWKAISPVIDVVYSSLEDPHSCDEFTDDVAALRLPSGFGVDIEWIPDQTQFLVRFFCGTFDSMICETKVLSAKDVVETVKAWLDDRSSETTYASSCKKRLLNVSRDTVSLLPVH
jgi:hypothetical protein